MNLSGGIVTYGEGIKKKKPLANKLWMFEGFPKLRNILYVDGSLAILISISQLCDNNSHVKFEKWIT